jgi:hypothetical protein
MERDDRATEPPAEEDPERSPQEQRGERLGHRPGESPGPLGNPEVDEEALSHRQQERRPPDGDESD